MSDRKKISVITWDGCFRGSFHTVDSFGRQEYPQLDYEFIWVDFHTNKSSDLLNRIRQYKNARFINLNNPLEKQWHLGVCMNEGIKASVGDILVLCDGDILVEPDQLKIIEKELNENPDEVIFFRRWDEPKHVHSKKSYNVEQLKQKAILNNPTNYAGCMALRKKTFDRIGFYEEHPVFEGAGAIGYETYLRLRNYGCPIRWHRKKVFHPWHPSTGISDKQSSSLLKMKERFSWLNPYNGWEQSWVLKCVETDLSYMADKTRIDNYLSRIPLAESSVPQKNRLKKIFKKLKEAL